MCAQKTACDAIKPNEIFKVGTFNLTEESYDSDSSPTSPIESQTTEDVDDEGRDVVVQYRTNRMKWVCLTNKHVTWYKL